MKEWIIAYITYQLNTYMTWKLVAINLVCFLMTGGGLWLINSLGNSYLVTIKKLQVYRLLTSMFYHDGISHLLCNMISLLIYGMLIEKKFGGEKMLMMYLLIGIGGGLISAFIHMILGDRVISVGASGAICGLMGIYVSSLLMGFGLSGNLLYVLIGLFLVIFIGYSSNADNISHFVSFFLGILYSIFILNL